VNESFIENHKHYQQRRHVFRSMKMTKKRSKSTNLLS